MTDTARTVESKVEYKLAAIDDLPPIGSVKIVSAGETKVLLTKDADGNVCALSAVCPHYKLPMKDAVVCDGHVRCPYHESAFDVKTGAVIDPPATEGIAVYPTRIDGGQVFVTVPAEDGNKPVPPGVPQPDPGEKRTFVLLGGGAASAAAAIRLREKGFAGRIVMITADRALPYDRPSLSKNYLTGQKPAEKLPLLPPPVWKTLNVTTIVGRATAVDAENKSLKLADGSAVRYDKLLLAPGGKPVPLDVPGGDQALLLRTKADADRIVARAESGRVRRAVVVGANFIGMEVAAALRQRGVGVTVVTPDAAPMLKAVGPEIAKGFRQRHAAKGTRFRFGANVTSVDGQGVLLDTGERLPAEIVVAGIGVKPATEFLPSAWVDDKGAVPVEKDLSVPGTGGNVYAGGDVAKFTDAQTGRPVRIEHWRVAEQHGLHVADAMLGSDAAFTAVPFFWTGQFGVSLQYVGHAEEPDEIVYDGDPTSKQFVAYFIKAGKIAAAAGIGRNRDLTAFLDWMTRHGEPDASKVKTDWAAAINA